jgi:hypothetical protein
VVVWGELVPDLFYAASFDTASPYGRSEVRATVRSTICKHLSPPNMFIKLDVIYVHAIHTFVLKLT